ncbi:hypothetical protein SAMN05216389_104250 [Oceanobacillus limi]|uniref:Coat F domain-containing protein n=1 Tax=Oceanobacillus limi TaxID=930131 RepID=A0A1I0B980_9BACI|nr:hypothetical protein [Oceanobacillus limi]SET03444.1 hypothetical protein SAMN05216389_104250 [Oceanobacillus limi]
MASLPAMDHALMVEHLSVHEGVITKLIKYQDIVKDMELRRIITLQIDVMRSHIWIMLAFINPDYHDHFELPPLPSTKLSVSNTNEKNYENDKWIVMEAHNTAANMASENFHSALKMKQENVQKAHKEMALQQLDIKNKYNHFIERKGWDYRSNISTQERIKTYLHFQDLLNL